MRSCKYDILREVWKSVAVPSIMYGMDVMAWSAKEISQLEVGQNRVARMALNAPRFAASEALRGDMGWSTFSERHMKATMSYRGRLEQMDNERLAKKVFMWNRWESKWDGFCRKMLDKCGIDAWRLMHRIRDGLERNRKEWKTVVNKIVRERGLIIWRNGMEQKKTLEWYKAKESPRYEEWYDG